MHTGRTGKKVYDFLEKRNMTAFQIEMESGVRVFREEMKAGLSGTGSSLQMIPTYLNSEGDIPTDTPVVVLDAGGTNFRVAEVSIDSEGNPRISQFSKHEMPGSTSPVDKRTFFDTIVDYMEPLLSSLNGQAPPHIGFCFSYPTEIYPNKDGRLLHFSKEIKAPEVEGELIGANLSAALRRRGFPAPSRIVLLNDTVATLLAGKAASEGGEYDGFVGFILGTGTNSAYIEGNENIKKLGISSMPGRQVINIESGNLNRINGGSIDSAFDATTKRPGYYRFEKMVSGAYLGALAGTVLMEACKAGLFSPSGAEKLQQIQRFDTITADGFLHQPARKDNPIAAACETDEDRLTAYMLIDNIIERAAKLAAINISATVLQEGGGTNPCGPVAICADGTTLFKTKDLLFRTRFYLKQFLQEKHSRYIRLLHQEDAPIIGSAVAALLSMRR